MRKFFKYSVKCYIKWNCHINTTQNDVIVYTIQKKLDYSRAIVAI